MRRAWRERGEVGIRSKGSPGRSRLGPGPARYTVEGTWRLLKRHGWSWQQPTLRAIECDDASVELWKKETWPRVRAPRRPQWLDRLRGRGRPVDDAAAHQNVGPDRSGPGRPGSRPRLRAGLDGRYGLLRVG
ncbi:winged helix-turn-helix domain-containing protein [Streptomyces sp. NPDC048644]|uniref:winged helix-turn-helix domain-containing protein n=1 Tax=Streptomyces sp. NPDC048644 TaxID=3365582 RepID=UPI00371FC103